MSSARSNTVWHRAAAALAVGWVVAAAGCTPTTPARGQAAATVFPLYDLARRVAGDRLQVRLILEPGMDPHHYQPRPQDVVGLKDAGLIFAVGLGLDPWAQSLAKSSGAGEARVFELGPLMDPILAPPGMIRAEPFIDPHFWTDPVRAQRAVDVIVEALSGLDPEGAPFYRERGSALRRSIQALHVEVSRQSQTWTRRRIVTAHGSLFYFAQRYGLAVVGVVEPVPGGGPQPEHLQVLKGELTAIEPAALFSEPQLDDQQALALAREAGVQVHKVDALGGTPEALSYETLVRGIARAMDEALR
jgi:ABC-type Zn uptake system ZnuABC Zn-binding protein ZnuA